MTRQEALPIFVGLLMGALLSVVGILIAIFLLFRSEEQKLPVPLVYQQAPQQIPRQITQQLQQQPQPQQRDLPSISQQSPAQEIYALRRDADRYRFYRDHWHDIMPGPQTIRGIRMHEWVADNVLIGKDFDAVIDEAMLRLR
jgi:hypothetical protein